MRAFDTLVSPIAPEIEQRQHVGSDKCTLNITRRYHVGAGVN
jgi:hypothetical protein